MQVLLALAVLWLAQWVPLLLVLALLALVLLVQALLAGLPQTAPASQSQVLLP